MTGTWPGLTDKAGPFTGAQNEVRKYLKYRGRGRKGGSDPC